MTVKALIISGFSDYGLLLDGGDALIQGNYVGTTASGSAALANTNVGVEIVTSGNTVGGTTAGTGNVISGNTDAGVEISGTGATGNVVAGNLVGLNQERHPTLAND